jgi:hypothetical protein
MKRALPIALLAVTFLMPGCILRGPENLRRDLERSSGVQLEKEVGVSVGRVGTMLVRWFTPEDEIPLKGVRKVQVGVYRVVDRPDGSLNAMRIPGVDGWQSVARVRERDERVELFVLEEDERIRGMLVVVAEPDEWVLVRIKGKLDHVFEQAMEMAFDRADRPELYEPTLADYRKGDDADATPAEEEAAG